MGSYFSHDSNARNSDRLIPLRAKMGAEGYGIYFMLLERLREEPEYQSRRDYDMLAFDLRVDVEKIRAVVEDFGLFTISEDGERFFSEGFLRRMELKDEASAAARARAEKRWGGQTDGRSRAARVKAAKERGTHTKEEWEAMQAYFKHACVACGAQALTLVKDHIIPLYKHGSDAINNIQPLCQSCSSRKAGHIIDYRLRYAQEHDLELPAIYRLPASIEASNAYGLQALMHSNKLNESKLNEIKEDNTPHEGGSLSISVKKEDVDKEWQEIMAPWCKYKAERGRPYTESGYYTAARKLREISGNSAQTARLIIERAITNGWSGFYALDAPRAPIKQGSSPAAPAFQNPTEYKQF